MKLVTRMTNAILALRGTPIGSKIETAAPKAIPPSLTTQPVPWYPWTDVRAFKKVTALADIINARHDCWEMYLNDGDVAAQIDGNGIDACARDNEGFPFRLLPDVQVGPVDDENGRRITSPEQDEINAVFETVEKIFKDIGLYDQIASSCSMAICQGEHHDEVVWGEVDGLMRPVKIDPIPGIRHSLIMQEMIDPEQGNAFVGYGLFEISNLEDPIRVFLPWQVMRYRWNNGIPLFASVRLTWKMLKENEEDVYGARKSRAYAKVNRILKDAGPEQILEFQAAENKMKRENPPGIDSDLITNAPAQLLDPDNAQLQHMDDMIYRRRIVQSAGRKPIGELAAYGADINRNTLDKQDETYVRHLTSVNSMASRPLGETVKLMLSLMGRNPADYPYEKKWTDKNPRDFGKLVTALGELRDKFGLSPQTGLSEAGYDFEKELDNNLYAARRLQELDQEADDFPGRVAQELDQLQRGRDGDPRQNGDRSGTETQAAAGTRRIRT